jgi:hypothetical protein
MYKEIIVSCTDELRCVSMLGVPRGSANFYDTILDLPTWWEGATLVLRYDTFGF